MEALRKVTTFNYLALTFFNYLLDLVFVLSDIEVGILGVASFRRSCDHILIHLVIAFESRYVVHKVASCIRVSVELDILEL